jgi:hypothetical protein
MADADLRTVGGQLGDFYLGVVAGLELIERKLNVCLALVHLFVRVVYRLHVSGFELVDVHEPRHPGPRDVALDEADNHVVDHKEQHSAKCAKQNHEGARLQNSVIALFAAVDVEDQPDQNADYLHRAANRLQHVVRSVVIRARLLVGYCYQSQKQKHVQNLDRLCKVRQENADKDQNQFAV